MCSVRSVTHVPDPSPPLLQIQFLTRASCPKTDNRVHDWTDSRGNNSARITYLLISELVAGQTGWSVVCTKSIHGHCTARIQAAETPPSNHRWSRRVCGSGCGDVWGFSPETRRALSRAQHRMDGHSEARADAAAGSWSRLIGTEPRIYSTNSSRNGRNGCADS